MKHFKFNEQNTDVLIYIGEINRLGYKELSNKISELENRKENILICMVTLGGDPDAGYRIGRCLQHYYPKKVSLFAPSLCKSSGTLTAVAANNLIIGNEGELGPLDIQLRKTDEIGEQSSGLDIFKAINFLEDRIEEQFIEYLGAIRFRSGVSTKLSADIAARLIQNIIEPIASQIDPIKIGEHQRAIGIAQQYGTLLNDMTSNLQDRALQKLIAGYPSHSFVIDRKEAQQLFKNVFKPCDKLTDCLVDLKPYFFDFRLMNQNKPMILIYNKVQQDEANASLSTVPADNALANPEQSSDTSRNKPTPKRSNSKGT